MTSRHGRRRGRLHERVNRSSRGRPFSLGRPGPFFLTGTVQQENRDEGQRSARAKGKSKGLRYASSMTAVPGHARGVSPYRALFAIRARFAIRVRWMTMTT
jgi:hypothetical protein